MNQIVIKLKDIKYKVNIVRYLSSYLSSLNIRPSYQA